MEHVVTRADENTGGSCRGDLGTPGCGEDGPSQHLVPFVHTVLVDWLAPVVGAGGADDDPSGEGVDLVTRHIEASRARRAQGAGHIALLETGGGAAHRLCGRIAQPSGLDCRGAARNSSIFGALPPETFKIHCNPIGSRGECARRSEPGQSIKPVVENSAIIDLLLPIFVGGGPYRVNVFRDTPAYSAASSSERPGFGTF